MILKLSWFVSRLIPPSVWVVVAVNAAAIEAAEVAYLHADQPSASRYVVDNSQSFTPLDSIMEVNRSSRGLYSVSFGGPLGTQERNVQISSMGADPGYCKLWGATRASITVACFDMQGNPDDREFNTLITLAGAGTMFMQADQSASSSYSPAENTTSASLRGRVRVERANTGVYYVHGTGIAGEGIGLQITATGRDATYCVDGRSRPDRAEVRCFAPGGEFPRGTLADSTFSLLSIADFDADAAFVRAYAETESSYVADSRNARSSEGGDVAVRMVGRGRYEADLGSIVRGGSTLQVVAQDRLPKVCSIDSWRSGTATVACFNMRGDPDYSPFILLARRAAPATVVISDPITPGPGPGPGPVPGPGPISLPEAEDFDVIDFDSLPDGSAVVAGSTVRFEYRELGALFANGVVATRCASSLPCLPGEATNQAAAPIAEGEFANRAFELNLTRGRQRVSFYVVANRAAASGVPITATAYDESGAVVDTVTTAPVSPGDEMAITLRSGEANIARVVITRGERAARPDNLLFVDTIRLYGDGASFAAYADDSRPEVSILSPRAFDDIESEMVDVEVETSDAVGIASVEIQVQMGGEILVPFGGGVLCGGTATACRGREFTGDIEIYLSEEGRYEILARACSTNGNCAIDRANVSRVFPERQQVDLWVMGLEYNQQWQDVIYTDLLNDGSEAGRVPLRHPSNRDTELSEAIVPGKPMVVRAYVGIREGTGSAEGVPVTGRLRVDDGTTGGMSRTFSPLINDSCASHLGDAQSDGQRCLAEVIAYPPLGDQGFETNTSYDLDLVRQRIHWEGTLNFVLPPEVTARAMDPSRGGTGLTFNFEVDPVDQWDSTRNPDGVWEETNPRDNQFQLQLENTHREEMNIRLVRVGMPGAPTPSLADAERVIEETNRILPLSAMNIISDDEFFYDGSTVTLEADFLGASINEELLNQCNALWLQLFQTYGLVENQPLLALVADRVDGCRGVGWAVPNLEVLREGRGRRLTYIGGIAHSLMPDYTDGEDWGTVAIAAMEVMHAAYDRRHVSNEHREAEGCPLSNNAGGDFLGFVADALGLGLDMSCYKLEVHPHGTIGTYPASVVRQGRPGDVSGTRRGGRVYGNLGGFGVRIDPDGSSFKLTMYDPCPTGPMDLENPRTVLDRRIDRDLGYTCTVGGDGTETLIPHDIMSYGPMDNRWYSIQITPGLKNLREGL